MRKLCTTLLLLFMCISLSGCDIKQIVNEIQDKANKENILEELSKDSKLAMSQETHDAKVKLKESLDKEANQESGWKFWEWHKDNYCMPLFKKSQEAKLKAKTSKAESLYNNAKAVDKVYQDAKEADRKESSIELQTTIQKYLPLIIILVVLIALVIIISLLRKKKPEQCVDEVPYTNHSGQLNVDYEGLLRNSCEKVGMNYDEVLKDYNGDVRKAYESVNLMILKGQV